MLQMKLVYGILFPFGMFFLEMNKIVSISLIFFSQVRFLTLPCCAMRKNLLDLDVSHIILFGPVLSEYRECLVPVWGLMNAADIATM